MCGDKEGEQGRSSQLKPDHGAIFSLSHAYFFLFLCCKESCFWLSCRAITGRERRLEPYVGSGPAGTGALGGGGTGPPTTPEFHQVRTSTGPNPTVKLVRKCMCSRLKRAEGIQTRAQPDTRGWKFPNGQLASPQSRLGGFHEERRLQQPTTSMHTPSHGPHSVSTASSRTSGGTKSFKVIAWLPSTD